MIVMRGSSGNGNYAAGVNGSFFLRSVKEAGGEDDVKLDGITKITDILHIIARIWGQATLNRQCCLVHIMQDN